MVAKPPAVLVHRNALEPRAEAALQRLRDQLGQRVYPIHRLDRAASGCLLFALERPWASRLQTALNAESAEKRYIAFVRGEFRAEGPVLVENPMADENGVVKEARSLVTCLGSSREPRCSLLLVEPYTGRYHQVRRHVRDLAHPIIGDTKHGDSRINRQWREDYGMRRLGLHCIQLSLPLDAGDERVEAVCPLFTDMHRVVSQMPWWEEAVEKFPALRLPPLEDDPVPMEVHT